MKRDTVRNLIRKRKASTRNLYITTIIGLSICIFSIQSIRKGIRQHEIEDRDTKSSLQHLARFVALRGKSTAFHETVIYHGLYHAYLNKSKQQYDSFQSLKKLRAFLELNLLGEIYIIQDFSIPFVNSCWPFRYRITAFADTLRRILTDTISDDIQDTVSLSILPDAKNRYSIFYFKRFIPDKTEEIINWIYGSEDYDDDNYQVYGSINNFGNPELYPENHMLIHEASLAWDYYEMDSSGNHVYDFLKKTYISKAEKPAFSMTHVNETVLTATFYGVNFTFGLILYLVPPFIAFFLLREFQLNRKIRELSKSKFSMSHLLIVDSRSLFEDANLSNSLSRLFVFLEWLLRGVSLLLLLYACLYRYNYTDLSYNNFLSIFENHEDWEMVLFDVVSLCCFIIVFAITDSYFRYAGVNTFPRRTTMLKTIDRLIWISLLTTPVLHFGIIYYFYPDYVHSQISTYSIAFVGVFIFLIAGLHFHASKKLQLPVFSVLTGIYCYLFLLYGSFKIILENI